MSFSFAGCSSATHHNIHQEGLNSLATLNQVVIELNEDRSGIFAKLPSSNRRYVIRNNQNQDVFYAIEVKQPGIIHLTKKPLQIRIFDGSREEVIYLHSPVNHQLVKLNYREHAMVYAPAGNLIGTIEEIDNLVKSYFIVKLPNNQTAFRIKKSWSQMYHYKIMSPDDTVELGHIEENWSGLRKELFHGKRGKTFKLAMPAGIDVKQKAILLSAKFFMDYIYSDREVGNTSFFS